VSSAPVQDKRVAARERDALHRRVSAGLAHTSHFVHVISY
jgi:hypothetical protein